MGKLVILHKVLGMVSTNVYLAVNTETKEGFIVDPSDRADVIENWIKEQGVTLKGILTTHGHFDHVGAASELKKKYQVPIYCMEAEKAVMEDSILNLSANWGSAFAVRPDVLLRDGECFSLAGCDITAYHTPGHTKGGACFYIEAEHILFSGDTIFAGTIGRTDFPTGSYAELVGSARRMIELVPEDTMIYPGHEDFTTAEQEKKYNPYI